MPLHCHQFLVQCCSRCYHEFQSPRGSAVGQVGPELTASGGATSGDVSALEC